MRPIDDGRRRVIDALSERLASFVLTPDDYKRAHVSPTTVAKILSGESVRNDAKKHVCALAYWTEDSIDRLEAGKEPVPVARGLPNTQVLLEMTDAMLKLAADMRTTLDEIQAQHEVR